MRGEKLAKSSGTFRSFKHRNFRIFFIASFCSNIGTWVQRIAQDWLVLELTNDAFQLGIVTGLQALPFIFFSSFGGKLADRFPKRKLLIIANSTVALWALILGVLVISGNVQIWHVYIIALLLGISSSIEAPIAQAFVTQIVPQEDMANAISLRAVNFNSARLIGPAVSGFMISAFGTGPSFIFNSISFVFILSALFFMRTGGITELNPEQGKVYIREALNYIRARPDLKALMLLTFFFATFGFNGFVTTFALKFSETSFLASPDWLYGLFGLGVVYTFFQIPLMFIVFLPAVENLKPQWNEASLSLGGSSKDYWFRIGFPVLFPSFLGGILLLFVNAFSAYATAAALISQGTIITPLDIGSALSSEVGGASAPLAKTLSLYMVAVVVIVMALYSLLRKRVSKWENTK